MIKNPVRIGVGGPVGAGKTMLVEKLTRAMHGTYEMAVITNDIYTKEIEIVKRKERFDALFEIHRVDYKMDKGSVMTEALRNLEKLHEAYPSLTRTEVAIIWLLFMKYSSDSICDVLNITHNYYYQRKSAIYRTFGIRGKDEGQEAIERIVKEYIALNNKN